MQHLFPSNKPLSLQSPALDKVVGAGSLVPLKLEGEEGINQLFEYKLTLQTPDALNFLGGAAANYALQDLVGHELCCQIELEGHGSFVAGLAGLAGMSNQGAGVREISGLITQARFLGEDTITVHGIAVALEGDMTHCPKCKGEFAILPSGEGKKNLGRWVAYADTKTACGAELIATFVN